MWLTIKFMPGFCYVSTPEFYKDISVILFYFYFIESLYSFILILNTDMNGYISF